ncbi:MAG: hypothetical protein ACREA9_27310 [Pyrinomonadaceae bacterium]
MPKDNENIPLPIWTTEEPDSAPLRFAPDQMMRCDECLRANPPTRVNCLYCRAVLPHNETNVNLQKPALRPLEKWEQGYNNILRPPVANLTAAELAEASDLLRLRPEDLDRILAAATPLPLARAATVAEALLVQRRLGLLGIDSSIMPDAEPGTDAAGVVKVRTLEIDEAGIYAYQSPEAPFTTVSWPDFVLLVVGRLIVRRVELKERKSARAENSIQDSSEFVTDETVVDFYTRQQAAPYRIAANSFDFSCLGASKGLLAGENISRLLQLFRERAPQAAYDDSFNSVRKTLEPVWPAEQQNESSGFRRERPGKYSIGSVMELNNEMQFSRYSRLRHYLQTVPSGQSATPLGSSETIDDDA